MPTPVLTERLRKALRSEIAKEVRRRAPRLGRRVRELQTERLYQQAMDDFKKDPSLIAKLETGIRGLVAPPRPHIITATEMPKEPIR